jgi:hypothetical protein
MCSKHEAETSWQPEMYFTHKLHDLPVCLQTAQHAPQKPRPRGTASDHTPQQPVSMDAHPSTHRPSKKSSPTIVVGNLASHIHHTHSHCQHLDAGPLQRTSMLRHTCHPLLAALERPPPTTPLQLPPTTTQSGTYCCLANHTQAAFDRTWPGLQQATTGCTTGCRPATPAPHPTTTCVV